MLIRPQTPDDIAAIRSLVTQAFLDAAHASGTEADIVDKLRRDHALTISLVAVHDGNVVGHVAFSPVMIDGAALGWFGLGPLAVASGFRRQGLGDALVRRGLADIRTLGAKGCVVLGDPAYYHRFGFEADPALRLADAPPKYFQRLIIHGPIATGLVTFHQAFDGS